MKTQSIVSRILLTKPVKRGMIEWALLLGTGLLGLVFSWSNVSIFPVSNILGGILIVLAFVFHGWAEKDHKQAHQRTDSIKKIVRSGIYSKIRHPLYLSFVIFNMGVALGFGTVVTLFLAVLTIFHWGATSYKEEEILMEKFQEEYVEYQKAVPWRMIPGIF